MVANYYYYIHVLFVLLEYVNVYICLRVLYFLTEFNKLLQTYKSLSVYY